MVDPDDPFEVLKEATQATIQVARVMAMEGRRESLKVAIDLANYVLFVQQLESGGSELPESVDEIHFKLTRGYRDVIQVLPALAAMTEASRDKPPWLAVGYLRGKENVHTRDGGTRDGGTPDLSAGVAYGARIGLAARWLAPEYEEMWDKVEATYVSDQMRNVADVAAGLLKGGGGPTGSKDTEDASLLFVIGALIAHEEEEEEEEEQEQQQQQEEEDSPDRGSPGRY